MLKTRISISFIISLLLIVAAPVGGSLSFASTSKLTKQQLSYGDELYNVPTIVRRLFQERTGKIWPDSTFKERYDFIISWEAQDQAVLDAKKSLVKKEAAEKKMLAEKQKERDKEKARQARNYTAKLKRAAMEEKRRDKKVETLKDDRELKLEDLRSAQKQREK